jgi:SAM-dependent methyltransferase
MSIVNKIESEHNQYYVQKSNAEDDAIKVGWKNIHSQHIRFEQLLRSFTFEENDTIIDLGCGLGDLYSYILEKYPNIHFKYIGYDVLPEMIERAKLKYKDTAATFIQIDELSEIDSADYILVSGIFNLKHSIDDDEWLNYIKGTVSLMTNKSQKGISFNCLTSFSDIEYKKQELYYANPMSIFEFCKVNLSKNVALYHDYQEYDFTISIKK